MSFDARPALPDGNVPRAQTTKRTNWIVLAAVGWLLLAAGFVRVAGGEKYVFSPDDVMHLNIAGQPTLVGLWAASLRQIHPPGLYLFYRAALAISRNTTWLRSVSTVIGLLGLLALFFAGRKAVGDLAGVVALGLASFSYGHVLQSQVVRHYGLLLLFLTLALGCFIAWHREPRRRHAAGLAGFGLLAVCTQYSAVIALAGMGGAWLLLLLAGARPRRAYALLGLAFLPAAAAFVAFFQAHVAGLFSSGKFGILVDGYLHNTFPATGGEFFANVKAQFGYLFIPPAAWIMIGLSAAGTVALAARGRTETALAIVAAFAVGVALNLAGRYPLSGTRHGMYLLPFVTVAAGAAVQWGWDWAAGRTVHSSPRLADWLRGHETAVTSAGLAALVAVSLLCLPALKRTDYLRRFAGPSWQEFPLTRESHDRTMTKLKRLLQRNDVVVITGQAAQYLTLQSGRPMEETPNGLLRWSDGKADYFSAPGMWSYADVLRFQSVYDRLPPPDPGGPPRRVWLFHLGWGKGFPDDLPRETIIETSGGTIYRYAP